MSKGGGSDRNIAGRIDKARAAFICLNSSVEVKTDRQKD